MHALITGGAGFIGSHLAETLLAQDHTVTAIDNLSTGRFDNIRHLQGHSAFRFINDSIAINAWRALSAKDSGGPVSSDAY